MWPTHICEPDCQACAEPDKGYFHILPEPPRNPLIPNFIPDDEIGGFRCPVCTAWSDTREGIHDADCIEKLGAMSQKLAISEKEVIRAVEIMSTKGKSAGEVGATVRKIFIEMLRKPEEEE